MVPENILLEFIPDMICFGVDILICGVIYKVYSKTHTLISAIKVSYFTTFRSQLHLLEYKFRHKWTLVIKNSFLPKFYKKSSDSVFNKVCI